MDREKVIDAFDEAKELVWTDDDEYTVGYNNGLEAGKNIAITLLKEQEEREQRICKSICNFIRCACSTDTDDDKDFVCYEIQKCFTEGR